MKNLIPTFNLLVYLINIMTSKCPYDFSCSASSVVELCHLSNPSFTKELFVYPVDGSINNIKNISLSLVTVQDHSNFSMDQQQFAHHP
jgi:hypothetical protein